MNLETGSGLGGVTKDAWSLPGRSIVWKGIVFAVSLAHVSPYLLLASGAASNHSEMRMRLAIAVPLAHATLLGICLSRPRTFRLGWLLACLFALIAPAALHCANSLLFFAESYAQMLAVCFTISTALAFRHQTISSRVTVKGLFKVIMEACCLMAILCYLNVQLRWWVYSFCLAVMLLPIAFSCSQLFLPCKLHCRIFAGALLAIMVAGSSVVAVKVGGPGMHEVPIVLSIFVAYVVSGLALLSLTRNGLASVATVPCNVE